MRTSLLNSPRATRYFSCTLTSKAQESFKHALRLPSTSFPLRSKPINSEVPFRKKTCDDLYQWQWKNLNGPLFVLHDGPPYANGRLHMGHALNKIIKDIIIRFNVLVGRKVHYVPGWDCHGLPVEHNALKQLGSDPHSLPASVIRSKAAEFAKNEIQVQKEEFRQLGIMADWDSSQFTYRTLDHEYEIRQLRIFQQMVDKGLIYRRNRPVHYSPSSRSALAEAELVYKDDHVSHSVYISFTLDSKSKDANPRLKDLLYVHDEIDLMIWTTTPWTLTANMGIAVHQDLTYSVLKLANRPRITIVAKERIEPLEQIIGPFESVAELKGSDIVGAIYTSPFATESKFEVIHSSHVTVESGTGLVHCAPAHGMDDYVLFQALGSTSDLLCHVDGEGKFTREIASVIGEAAAKSVIGLDVLNEGSKAIANLLEETGALVKIQRIKHKYPYDWKTGDPVIIVATSQWFADLDNVKIDALKALQSVAFYPSISRNRLESFTRSRSEWCISRQRAWGVPIPALYHIPTGRAVLDSQSLEHILNVLQTKGVDYWWEGPVEEFVPPDLQEDGIQVSEIWKKGTDTMDVWFDSGTSWSMLNGHIAENREFRADLCVEGSDQHRGWFQSQLLTHVGSSGESQAPYATLITHGMVLDQSGKKMSKSLGNIISPMTIINGGKKEPAHGADLLRLWVATVEYGTDSPIGPTILAQCTEVLRKVRNSARFILGNIGDKQSRSDFQSVPQKSMKLAERFMMHELYKLEQTAMESYRTYNFPKAALSNFANITLSSLYFDITKDCLYAGSINGLERRSVVTVLEQVLNTMTSVFAPVLPHLAEEVHYHHCGGGGDVEMHPSIFKTKWQLLDPIWEDPIAEQEMNELLRVRGVVLSLLEKARIAKQLRSSLEAEVDLIFPNHVTDNSFVELLHREEDFLKTLFIVSDTSLTDEGSLGTTSPNWMYSETLSHPEMDSELCIRVRPATLEKCPRCWKYTRNASDSLCRNCESVVHE